jgi:ribosome-binding protein aMBF1 (putative translation factor)
LEKLGYKVIIINAREFEKQSKYVNYYKHLCELLGFELRKNVIEEPYKYLGYTEIDRNFKQKYIDENINKLPLTRKEHYYLNKYINQLYGFGLKEYKEKNLMKRFRHSVDKKEIIKYKTENPTISNSEIAKHFGVSKNTIQQATVGMQGSKRI